MRFNFLIILILALVLSSCSGTKTRLSKKEVIEKEVKEYTTYFYNPIAFIISEKKVYNLSERKQFDIRLINTGTKDLYFPKRIAMGAELSVTLKRKDDKADEYGLYKPTGGIIKIDYSHPNESVLRREVISIKNSESVIFKNYLADPKTVITNEGKYHAEININLSKFGYFAPIKTEFTFEVVADSVKLDKTFPPRSNSSKAKWYNKKD